jgi:predicted nucleic acid-binding protein
MEDRALRRWLLRGERLGISAIAWAEFQCGPLAPSQNKFAVALLGAPIAFTADDAVRAAELFRIGGRRRGTLADCMIAAVALRSSAALATSNAVDFERLEGEGLTVLALSA